MPTVLSYSPFVFVTNRFSPVDLIGVFFTWKMLLGFLTLAAVVGILSAWRFRSSRALESAALLIAPRDRLMAVPAVSRALPGGMIATPEAAASRWHFADADDMA